MATTWSDKEGPVQLASNVDKKINSLKDMMILFKRSSGLEYQIWIIAEVSDSTYEIMEAENEICSLSTKSVLRTATTIKLKAEPFNDTLVKQEFPQRESKSSEVYFLFFFY